MKLINFLFLSFILYEILAKDSYADEYSDENELIEDDEFVYSNVEEIQKNKQKEQMEEIRLKIEKKMEEERERIDIERKNQKQKENENQINNQKNNQNENPNQYHYQNINFDQKKEEKKENINIMSAYPELSLGLDDMLKISKKLYFDRNEILLIWEYFMQIKKQFYFDFLFLNNPGKEILIDKKENNTTSNYMFFHSFDFYIFYNNFFEEQNLIAIIISMISIFMCVIPYKLTITPKFNLAVLLVFLFIYYIFMDYLYMKRYHFCSFFVYFLTVFNIEKIWNMIFLLENPDEMEENLKMKNNLFDASNFKTKGRFIRKLILSLIVLTLSIYISFTKFRSFYFYSFQFYIIRLLRLILIRYFKYNNDTPFELQPFENFIDIILALFSLMISNFYYYSNTADSHDLLGLIVIYNLISFYYLTSLDKFLYIYRNGLSDIYFEYSCYMEKNETDNSSKSQSENKKDKDTQSNSNKKEEKENPQNRNLEICKEAGTSINSETKSGNRKRKNDRERERDREKEKDKDDINQKNEEDSSDDEVLTIENLKKFENFDKLVEKINLKRYYRIDILNVGNIVDIVLISLILLLIIFSFILESLFLLFLAIYLINIFMKHCAIYLSIKYSRLASNIFQIILLLAIYNINFQSFDLINLLFFKSEDSNYLKVSLKILIKFILLSLSFISLFINIDFFSYFNIYYYTSYKYILQEGVNMRKIKENTELMFRINEIYNIKSSLEEIFCFNLDKSVIHLNYIFENCKFLSKKTTDFTIVEYCLEKNTKSFNLVLLIVDYFSLYFCYWITFFTFKDNGNIFYYPLFILFKTTLIIKFAFISFEYSKSPKQKFLILFMNTIFLNRLSSYFCLFSYDQNIFYILSYFNKAVYIYNLDNSFILNVYFTFLEFLEFRVYGNYVSFVLTLSLLCNKSLLFCLGKTNKSTKIITFTFILTFISGFIYSQVDKYLYILYDSMKGKVIQHTSIDWIGFIEYIYFNSINIPVRYTGKNYDVSHKNSIFMEVIYTRELLKYLVKLKLFLI